MLHFENFVRHILEHSQVFILHVISLSLHLIFLNLNKLIESKYFVCANFTSIC